MARDFDKEIQTTSNVIEASQASMETVRQQFIAAVVKLLHPWYWSKTEQEVKGNPEQTKSLGVDQLRLFKAEVKALQEKTEAIVLEFFDKPRLWWHQEQADQMYYMDKKRGGPGLLEQPFWRAAGQLGPILEKYGYVSTSTDRKTSSPWRETDSTGMRALTERNPLYRGVEWSSEMRSLIDQYRDLGDELKKQQITLSQIKIDKAETEASDLWDQA